MRCMNRPVLILGLVLVASLGCAKKSTNPLLSLPTTETSASLFIPQIDTQGEHDVNRIFVFAVDNLGNPISGLQVGNFSIIEGSDPGVPFEAGPVTEPLYLVMVMDRSGSMDSTKMETSTTAAINFVSGLAPNDYTALIEFSDTVKVSLDFTTNHVAMNNAINDITIDRGATALLDATIQGAELLNGRAGRRMMIVLTDGLENASSVTLGQAIDRVNALGLSAYPVGFGTDVDTDFLNSLGEETGGQAGFAPDVSDVGALVTAFNGFLERFNNLTYIKYRRRQTGIITVYLNYGAITATASKDF